MNVPMLLLGIAIGAAVGGLTVWLVSLTRVARDTFASLSAEALRQNNQSFLTLAQTKLGEFQLSASSDLEKRQKAVDDLVRPIHDALVRVDGKLHEVEKDRIASYSGLLEQVKAMAQTQQALQAETGNLVKALRAPQVRGRWGEIQLRRVVEMAGMLDYCDFVEQARVETEDGRMQPDLIIRLPGDKTIVVDAKSPLAAYLDASDGNCEDGARDLLLKKHARQVRDHMVKLGGKAYWNQFQPAPDFVVMFLPGETFFSAACQHDPSLIEFGVGDPGEPDDSDRPAPRDRLRLAAGEHRPERSGDQQAGSGAVRAAGQHGRSTSRICARRWSERWTATTTRSARWREECSSRRGGFGTWELQVRSYRKRRRFSWAREG